MGGRNKRSTIPQACAREGCNETFYPWQYSLGRPQLYHSPRCSNKAAATRRNPECIPRATKRAERDAQVLARKQLRRAQEHDILRHRQWTSQSSREHLSAAWTLITVTHELFI